MGTQRTSNKDIATKLDTLIDILTSQAQTQAPAPEQAPIEAPAPVTQAPKGTTLKVGGETLEVGKKFPTYMAHMEKKVAKLSEDDGQSRVLYLRRNLSGEVKIAYCLHSRWASLKDNGMIGAIRQF